MYGNQSNKSTLKKKSKQMQKCCDGTKLQELNDEKNKDLYSDDNAAYISKSSPVIRTSKNHNSCKSCKGKCNENVKYYEYCRKCHKYHKTKGRINKPKKILKFKDVAQYFENQFDLSSHPFIKKVSSLSSNKNEFSKSSISINKKNIDNLKTTQSSITIPSTESFESNSSSSADESIYESDCGEIRVESLNEHLEDISTKKCYKSKISINLPPISKQPEYGMISMKEHELSTPKKRIPEKLTRIIMMGNDVHYAKFNPGKRSATKILKKPPTTFQASEDIIRNFFLRKSPKLEQDNNEKATQTTNATNEINISQAEDCDRNKKQSKISANLEETEMENSLIQDKLNESSHSLNYKSTLEKLFELPKNTTQSKSEMSKANNIIENEINCSAINTNATTNIPVPLQNNETAVAVDNDIKTSREQQNSLFLENEHNKSSFTVNNFKLKQTIFTLNEQLQSLQTCQNTIIKLKLYYENLCMNLQEINENLYNTSKATTLKSDKSTQTTNFKYSKSYEFQEFPMLSMNKKNFAKRLHNVQSTTSLD